MHDVSVLGRLLVAIGILLVFVGAFLLWGGKSLPIGRLPGDFIIRRGNVTFFFPLTSGLLISAILSLLLRWMRR